MSVEGFALTVPGEPRGKQRPRFVRATGRTYTDDKTVSAEERIRVEWIAAGRPRVDGPLQVSVVAQLRRPKAHLLVSGDLSAQGKREPLPVRKPDVDNVLKLICDALNGLAYDDDAQIVEATVVRCWGPVDTTWVQVRGFTEAGRAAA